MNVMDSDVFYDTYIAQDFETIYVPFMFEKICKQYLIRKNQAGNMSVPFYQIGKYYYDDSKNKINGEFDVVTLDQHGYIFYECKFMDSKITKQMIEKEIKQVNTTGLQCYQYGFFSKCGFEDDLKQDLILYHLDDLFQEEQEKIDIIKVSFL